MTQDGKKLLDSFRDFVLPVFFVKWLDSPTEDWNIALQLLDFVKTIVSE